MSQKIFKMIEPEVRSIDESTRTIWHKITSEVVDRMGDIVRIGGLDMNAFRQKPAVLYGHSYQGVDPVPVVGECVGIERRGLKLWAGTHFLDPKQVSPKLGALVNDLWYLNKKKLMGWSISFVPHEFEALKDENGKETGWDFKSGELLEYSNVLIPANQECVNDMISKGFLSKAVMAFAGKAPNDTANFQRGLKRTIGFWEEFDRKLETFRARIEKSKDRFYYKLVPPEDVDPFKRKAGLRILQYCKNHFECPKILGTCDDIGILWVRESWCGGDGAVSTDREFLGQSYSGSRAIDVRCDIPFHMIKHVIAHEVFHVFSDRKREGRVATAEEARLEELGAHGFADMVRDELLDLDRWAKLG